MTGEVMSGLQVNIQDGADWILQQMDFGGVGLNGHFLM